MSDNMIQWWVVYGFAAPLDLMEGHRITLAGRDREAVLMPLWEPVIVRLLADLTTGEPCVYCFERRLAKCPGIRSHVAMERDRAELDTAELLHTAMVTLPAELDWYAAMHEIRRLILARNVISQQ